jgi:LmbE family N-acetylglucosaminyl deacetylase
MRPLQLAAPGESLSVLCLGAHSDDIEIGAGGTILALIESGVRLDVTWCVLSANAERRDEAEKSARAFCVGADRITLEFGCFRDSYFPYQAADIKPWLADIGKRASAPDLIFTHRRDDAHQDHREVSMLTWNLFRDHLILEYEIPKWDGDLGQPNTYVALTADILQRKIELLHEYFGSQRSKDWFDDETFRGLSRLRGMECRAPEFYAEGFFLRKLRLR